MKVKKDGSTPFGIGKERDWGGGVFRSVIVREIRGKRASGGD